MLVSSVCRSLLKIQQRCITTTFTNYQQAEILQENEVDSFEPSKIVEETKPALEQTKKKKLFQYYGKRPREKIQTTNHISSFVATSQELACVTMTRGFELTGISTVSLERKWGAQNCSQYFSTIYPLIKNLPDVDAHIIENCTLPSSYHSINMHLRSITMLLIGMLENPEQSSIFAGKRYAVGRHAQLSVKGTASRMCSKKLVHQIVQDGYWGNTEVKISPELLTTSSDCTFYAGENSCQISHETADALIQALCFWQCFTTKDLF
uniref:Uncharacterized protein n=1 Tax=Ciona savignyi TaxID=51511 RepID=H2Z5C8_CIOSA